MTAKEKLRKVVDDLSEQEAEATLGYINQRRSQGDDPVAEMLDAAPADDEPSTPEEEEGVREARAEYERGEVYDAEQIKREIV